MPLHTVHIHFCCFIDNMMADQPVPEAVMSEEQSFIQAVNFEEQSAPAVSQQYAPSQYAQLGQFRYICINF